LWSKRVVFSDDKYALGGYAIVDVGTEVDVRKVLAAPIDDTLFFAGEATAHDTNVQTAHGAFESGHRAAVELLASTIVPRKPNSKL